MEIREIVIGMSEKKQGKRKYEMDSFYASVTVVVKNDKDIEMAIGKVLKIIDDEKRIKEEKEQLEASGELEKKRDEFE